MDSLLIQIIIAIVIIYIITRFPSPFSSIKEQIEEQYPLDCLKDNRQYPSGHIPAFGYLSQTPQELATLNKTF